MSHSVNNVASDLLSLLNQSMDGTSNIANDLLTLIESEATHTHRHATEAPTENSSIYFLSHIEQSILRNVHPIEVNETEELTILGQRGLWINKAEVDAWRGDLNITEYSINEDQNPQIITRVKISAYLNAI